METPATAKEHYVEIQSELSANTIIYEKTPDAVADTSIAADADVVSSAVIERIPKEQSPLKEIAIKLNSNYIGGLDGLRFIAALWMFWEHFGFSWTVEGTQLEAMRNRGQIPLQYFFLMGGMVLFVAYANRIDFSDFRKKAEFWIQRISRVGPGYWLFLFIDIPQMSAGYYYGNVTGVGYFYMVYFLITTPLFLQGWALPNQYLFYSLSWGGFLWAMSSFVFYWFCFPWLYWFVIRPRPLWLEFVHLFISYLVALFPFGIFMLLIYIPYWTSSEPFLSCPICVYWWLRSFPPLRLSSQMMGMILGKIWISTAPEKRSHWINGILGDLCFVATLVCAFFIPTEEANAFERTTWPMGMADIGLSPLQLATLWRLASGKGVLAFLFGLKPLIYCGKLSFGIWVYQGISSYVFLSFRDQKDWWVTLLALVMLLGSSMVSYHLFEEQARIKVNSLIKLFKKQQ